MTLLTIAAWLATAAILLSYARTTRNPEKVTTFHWCNALGCIPLIILNAQAAVWPAVVVNVGFGVPAAWALWSRSRRHTAAVVTLQDLLDEFAADLERVSGVSDLQRGFIAGELDTAPPRSTLQHLPVCPATVAWLSEEPTDGEALSAHTLLSAAQPVQEFGYWDQDVEDRHDRGVSPHHPDYQWKETR